MKNKMFSAFIAMALFVICVMSLSTMTVFANTYYPTSQGQEIPLPEDLDFSINDCCSGHLYFSQAAAREDGSFLIYSRHHTPQEVSEDNFKRVYIDIYDKNGNFIEELSFISPHEFTVEFTDSTVNFYYYSSMLVFDVRTRQLKNQKISPEEFSNLSRELKAKNFQSGEWEYSCKRGFEGYIRLNRTDGTSEQVLVEMQGTGWNFSKNFIKSFITGMLLMTSISAGIVFLIVWIKDRKNKKTN